MLASATSASRAFAGRSIASSLTERTTTTRFSVRAWAAPVTYASLQILQQAIEKVGKVDRAAVIKEIHNGTFDTIIGKIKLEKGLRMNSWQVGQWQNGEYYGVAPANLPGAKPVQLPKPAWKSGS